MFWRQVRFGETMYKLTLRWAPHPPSLFGLVCNIPVIVYGELLAVKKKKLLQALQSFIRTAEEFIDSQEAHLYFETTLL